MRSLKQLLYHRRPASLRTARNGSPSVAAQNGGSPSAAAQNGAPSGGAADRRHEARWTFQRPAIVVPVLPDGMPDLIHETTGRTIDLSATGACVEVPSAESSGAVDWVIGVEGADGVFSFAGARLRNSRPQPSRHVRVGYQFGGLAQRFLSDDFQEPAFDPQTTTFVHRFAPETLEAWIAIGVLQNGVCDRIEVCPTCGGALTFRPACRQCGSACVENETLIHHFACAHVGPVEDFQSADGLVCPKCRTEQLVVNSDFEFVAGPFRCTNCQWIDMELETMGQCLACGRRFPAREARLLDVRGYHVHRLDLLAVGATS